jgi:hypothetical protein
MIDQQVMLALPECIRGARANYRIAFFGSFSRRRLAKRPA